MKEKIFNALKTKYSNFGFGDKALEGVAESLARTVTKEEDIETAVSGVEPLLKSLQPQFDQLRNEKSGLQKQLDELKEGAKQEPPKEGEPTVDLNKPLTKEDIQKIVSESLKPISDKFSEQDAKAKEAAFRQQVIAKAKEVGIPEAVAKYMSVSQEANLDDFMKKAKQDFSDNGFSEAKAPESAEAQIKSDSENIAGMIKTGTENIVKTQQIKQN